MSRDMRYWSWASGFHLTEAIPEEMLNEMVNLDGTEEHVDKWIDEHRTEQYEFSDIDYIWDEIENLAWDACLRFDFKQR